MSTHNQNIILVFPYSYLQLTISKIRNKPNIYIKKEIKSFIFISSIIIHRIFLIKLKCKQKTSLASRTALIRINLLHKSKYYCSYFVHVFLHGNKKICNKHLFTSKKKQKFHFDKLISYFNKMFLNSIKYQLIVTSFQKKL